MKNEKTLSLLGISRRAGKIEAGYDAVVLAIKEKKASLIAVSQDISEKTFKNIKYEAQKEGIPAKKFSFTIEELAKACKVKAGIVAVCDDGLAKAVLKTVSVEETKEEANI